MSGHGAPQLRHAADPAFIIRGLYLHVTAHTLVRRDQEIASRHGIQRDTRDLGGLHDAIDVRAALQVFVGSGPSMSVRTACGQRMETPTPSSLTV